MVAAVRHLAIFASCYVAAQVIAAAVLVGADVSWRAVLVAALTGLGTYLVDRSRPFAGTLDRGDLRAEPERVRFMLAYQLPVRLLAVVALVIALVLALPWGVYATLVPLSVVGLLCYSRWSRHGRRLKDLLWLKNPTVAVSITAFALLLVYATSATNWPMLLLAGVVLLTRITADAMRCDIDDAESDARQGTRTVANVLGVPAAWRLALLLDVVAAGAACAEAPHIGWLPAIAMGGIPLAAGCVLTMWKPRRSRDLVDAFGAISVLVAWCVVAI
jgi:4-hydroxybenzoate polyprenyltransferase